MMEEAWRPVAETGERPDWMDEWMVPFARTIHAALGAYTCTIDDLVVTGDSVAARMTFEGRHRGDFFGVAPAGKTVRWAGASFFRMAEDRIADLEALSVLRPAMLECGLIVRESQLQYTYAAKMKDVARREHELGRDGDARGRGGGGGGGAGGLA